MQRTEASICPIYFGHKNVGEEYAPLKRALLYIISFVLITASEHGVPQWPYIVRADTFLTQHKCHERADNLYVPECVKWSTSQSRQVLHREPCACHGNAEDRNVTK